MTAPAAPSDRQEVLVDQRTFHLDEDGVVTLFGRGSFSWSDDAQCGTEAQPGYLEPGLVATIDTELQPDFQHDSGVIWGFAGDAIRGYPPGPKQSLGPYSQGTPFTSWMDAGDHVLRIYLDDNSEECSGTRAGTVTTHATQVFLDFEPSQP